jgi:predicted Zn-dependent protease
MKLRRLREAHRWAACGAPRRAVALFDRVLARDPADRGAWLWSGVAMAECGRPDEARARVSRGVELAPLAPAGRLLLARVLHDGGQVAEARAELERYPGREHNHVAATLMAACCIRLGDVERAAAVLPRTLPSSPWVLARLLAAVEERTPLLEQPPEPLPENPRTRGGVRRGLLHLRDERWTQALAAFRAASPSPLTVYGQAVALYYLHHLDEAEALLSRLVEPLQEPFASDAVAILGKVDLERGRNTAGVLRLRQAIAGGAASPENYYALGVGLLRQGARRLAVRRFELCASAEFVGRRFGDLRATFGPGISG